MTANDEAAKFPELLALARERLAAGASVDEILDALRERSPSVIQSMKVMRDLLQIPMSEAKLLVHRSRTWSDMRDVFSEVHDVAEQEYRTDARGGQDGTTRVEIDLDRKKGGA